MAFMRQLFLAGVMILTVNFVFGVDMKVSPTISADNEEAIKKTQELLKNPSNLQNNFEATKLFELMGNSPQSNQDLSNTSASIFSDLAAKTGGDPEKLKKLLEEAKKNPEAFANQLSPEQKAAISELARKIESNKSEKTQNLQIRK